jgi:hypothetical protein
MYLDSMLLQREIIILVRIDLKLIQNYFPRIRRKVIALSHTDETIRLNPRGEILSRSLLKQT